MGVKYTEAQKKASIKYLKEKRTVYRYEHRKEQRSGGRTPPPPVVSPSINLSWKRLKRKLNVRMNKEERKWLKL